MAIDGLGRPLTVQEAARALGVDEATATRYFSTLGGVRIGKRRIVFFERKVLDAIEKLQLEQGGLELRPHLFFLAQSDGKRPHNTAPAALESTSKAHHFPLPA